MFWILYIVAAIINLCIIWFVIQKIAQENHKKGDVVALRDVLKDMEMPCILAIIASLSPVLNLIFGAIVGIVFICYSLFNIKIKVK